MTNGYISNRAKRRKLLDGAKRLPTRAKAFVSLRQGEGMGRGISNTQ
jgi:hypothetical protein